MKYTSDTTLGNYEIYEVYEESPEEIAELKHMIDNEPSTKQFDKIEGGLGELRELLTGTSENKEEQVYDIDEAAEYIAKDPMINMEESKGQDLQEFIRDVLEIETDYMKLIGIIDSSDTDNDTGFIGPEGEQGDETKPYYWRIKYENYRFLSTSYLNVIGDGTWIMDHPHSATRISYKELKEMGIEEMFEVAANLEYFRRNK